ncbi:DASH complex subunit Dad1-domain-containing protein [Phyllosticta citriasiana]|uniref:DASH complex subunit Dad1-domain-containing protein n=1 Tax=Phyllosticta citriasiana TaxID=595635 RepID=UPI0030FD6D02
MAEGAGKAGGGNGGMGGKSYFEQQREALVGEIAVSLESVLQNINRLNRSLEGVIAVGNEFGSVEALWSQFENVMGAQNQGQGQGQSQNQAHGQSQGQGQGQKRDGNSEEERGGEGEGEGEG